MAVPVVVLSAICRVAILNKTAFLVTAAFFYDAGECFRYLLTRANVASLWCKRRPTFSCSDWYCLVMEQCRVDVIVWRAHLDIDLYGGGSRDRTAWETSFRPHSLAEISVAEPGSFELHYLVSRWYSRCCCQPGNYRLLILGFLRRSFNNSLIFYQSALIFVDSWKLSFLILGFLRQRLQLRDILLVSKCPKKC